MYKRMFWTDKGPKYILIMVIISLSIYMFYNVFILAETEILEEESIEVRRLKAAL